MEKIKRTKFNVSLLGETQVGKTCMVQVLTGTPFSDIHLSTIGIDSFTDSAKFDNVEYKFKIFDTAGQERYRNVSNTTINIADGFLMVFSVDNRETFERINDWINVISDEVNLEEKVIFLVGNKIDVEKREVSNEEGINFAKEKNIKYFETSAKTGFGIKETFKQLYQDIYELFKKSNKLEINNKNITLNKKEVVSPEQNKKKSKFC